MTPDISDATILQKEQHPIQNIRCNSDTTNIALHISEATVLHKNTPNISDATVLLAKDNTF